VHPRQFNAGVIVVFALTALLLAAVGVYGVAAEAVALRTRELGVRAALGATGAQLEASVMKGGLGPIAGGVILGIGAALGLTRWLSSALYGVAAHDPITLIGVVMLTSTVGSLALYVAARRAARIDPVIALRQ
jgi:ABC-type antimicrobial peptide transport system permease subunit